MRARGLPSSPFYGKFATIAPTFDNRFPPQAASSAHGQKLSVDGREVQAKLQVVDKVSAAAKLRATLSLLPAVLAQEEANNKYVARAAAAAALAAARKAREDAYCTTVLILTNLTTSATADADLVCPGAGAAILISLAQIF